MPSAEAPAPAMRLDKWLWAARLCKTRALAAEWADAGRIEVDGHPAKPGRNIAAGCKLLLRLPGGPPRELKVLALSATRGPAAVARMLYEESESSLAARNAWAVAARLASEPAASREGGRPTKRDRRTIESVSGRWVRWSAALED